MKIAIIGINYCPEETGIAVYTTGLADYLASRGHDVYVRTGFPYYPQWRKRPADQGALSRREAIGGVSVRRSFLYVPQRPGVLWRLLHELSFVASCCLGFLFDERPDVAIVVSPPLFLCLPVLLLARLKGAKTVLHVQDLQPDAAIDLGMISQGLQTRILFRLERLGYGAAHLVSSIGEGMLAKIASKGVPAEKLLLFRNWANDDGISPQDKRTAYRSQLGLKDDDLVLLYSGNIGVKQGLEVLVEAAALLQDRRDLHIVIAGDGAARPAVTQSAEQKGLGNVHFLPVQPFARLSELLATADISVITQRKGVKEIFLPSKLPNIMASARPVVATSNDDSELAAIIRESGCGLVAPPEDPAALAAAIRQLLDQPELRQRMGRSGRSHMERTLARKTILNAFAERLETLCGPARRKPR